MKGIDLFLGIKAEQTLRDMVRAATEELAEEADTLELCPVGKKDWIAGMRLEAGSHFGDLEKNKKRVITSLIELQSHQRIRQEYIRLYSIRPLVPVFKDSAPSDLGDHVNSRPPAMRSEVTCPRCGAKVNRQNIIFNPQGTMVGCYLCSGR